GYIGHHASIDGVEDGVAKEAIAILSQAVKDPDKEVRIEVLHALGLCIGALENSSPKEAVATLAQALKDHDEEVRETAAWRLSGLDAQVLAFVDGLPEATALIESLQKVAFKDVMLRGNYLHSVGLLRWAELLETVEPIVDSDIYRIVETLKQVRDSMEPYGV